MGWLFKTKKERAREARRERRGAFRQAQNAADDVKDRIRSMERESKKAWENAIDATKGGQKAAAQRHLTSFRAHQVLMTKLEQKRWVFEQYLAKMEMAQSDSEFADALGAVNKVTNIDTEKVADVFEASKDLLSEQMDTERFWAKLYEKEMDGAEGALEDFIPSMEDLEKQLQDEAAVEIGNADATDRISGEIEERIKAGEERVKKLLDGK